MTIWGRRDGESSAEEAHEDQAGARAYQAEAQDTQEPAAEHQAGEPEPEPAFWQAQGQTQDSLGRDPADAPVPVLTGVVIDGETVAEDPAPAGSQQPSESEDQAGTRYVEAGGPGATEIQEPTVAVAHDPVMTEAQEPVVTEPRDEAGEPATTEAPEPAVIAPAVAPESALTEAGEPAAEAHEPSVAESPEPAPGGTGQPVAETITPQRWSEILVAFVDDPRGSVKMAADAVDEAIEEFVDSVRARQRDLTATWQSAGADTEQLRTALREYRKLGLRVQQLDLGEKTAP
jgi:hypothetical protein